MPCRVGITKYQSRRRQQRESKVVGSTRVIRTVKRGCITSMQSISSSNWREDLINSKKRKSEGPMPKFLAKKGVLGKLHGHPGGGEP